MEDRKGELKSKTDLLDGRNIILGVTGSISAVESVKLIHELRRHGATVHPVMTESARKIINPNSLEYASENPVVLELTGSIEHVRLVEDADLFLIAPSTANSISKMALGIDDTPVTSVFSNALEKIPVIIVPAMHQNMYSNPIILKNIETLKSYGVLMLDPIFEESKAKIADYENITAEVIRALHSELKGRKISIVGGASEEEIDDVRVITNKSTGETAVDLATMAYYLGADLRLYFGKTAVRIPNFLKYEGFSDIRSLLTMVNSIRESDVVIVPAALSDFSVQKKTGKISSERDLALNLRRNPKFLGILRKGYKGKIVGFKAEYGLSKKELLKKARDKIKEFSLDMVVANDFRDVKAGYTKVLIVREGIEEEVEGGKIQVAKRILELLP